MTNPNYTGITNEIKDVPKWLGKRYQVPRDRYIDPRSPDYIAPEAYCPKCEDHTTLITAQGECKTCGTEVRK